MIYKRKNGEGTLGLSLPAYQFSSVKSFRRRPQNGRKTAVRGRLRPGLYENRLFVRGAVNSSSVISFCVICSQEPKRIFRHL